MEPCLGGLRKRQKKKKKSHQPPLRRQVRVTGTLEQRDDGVQHGSADAHDERRVHSVGREGLRERQGERESQQSHQELPERLERLARRGPSRRQ